jgi:hypothetical protein
MSATAPAIPRPSEAGRRPRAAVRRAASRIPVALVVLALPLVRPNIFGEFASFAGFGLLALAAVLAVLLPVPSGARPVPRWTATRPAMVLVLFLALAYLWLLVQAAALDPLGLGRSALQGTALTVGGVVAVVVVCADPRARLAVGRAFVLVIAVLCASYVVTALLWAVAGIGTGAVVSIPAGTSPDLEPVFFPFTPTLGTQAVLGLELPRFTGLGREPGWMAMYCAVAYFMTDMVGWRSRRLKVLLVVGLVGSVSTAGFGVFVVAWTYHSFLRDRGTGISLGGFLRQVLGLASLAGAVWLAIAAPVLGLAAKETQNVVSLDERQVATEAGLHALTTEPLGGPPTVAQAGINLISDIAVSGLPFVVLVTLALLLPPALHRGPARFSNAVVACVFLTLLLSQPPKDSTWAYAVVALAVALRGADMEPLVPTSSDRPLHPRGGRHERS